MITRIFEYIFSIICITIEFVLGLYENICCVNSFNKNDFVLQTMIDLKPEYPVPPMFDERYNVPFKAVDLLSKEIDRRVDRVKKLNIETGTSTNVQLDAFCTKWTEYKEKVDDLKIELVTGAYINGMTYRPLTKEERTTDEYQQKLNKLLGDTYERIFDYKFICGEYLNEIQEIEKKAIGLCTNIGSVPVPT